MGGRVMIPLRLSLVGYVLGGCSVVLRLSAMQNYIFALWAHAWDTGGQWHLLCNLDIFLWNLYFWYEKRGSPKTYPVSNPETYPFSIPETYPFVEWGYISRRVTPLSYRQSTFLSTPKRHPPPIFIFFLTIVNCISIITVKSYISLANLPTFSTYI